MPAADDMKRALLEIDSNPYAKIDPLMKSFLLEKGLVKKVYREKEMRGGQSLYPNIIPMETLVLTKEGKQFIREH